MTSTSPYSDIKWNDIVPWVRDSIFKQKIGDCYMYNDKESRKYVFNQNFLFTEVIRIAGKSEYKGALAKDMQYSKIIY